MNFAEKAEINQQEKGVIVAQCRDGRSTDMNMSGLRSKGLSRSLIILLGISAGSINSSSTSRSQWKSR